MRCAGGVHSAAANAAQSKSTYLRCAVLHDLNLAMSFADRLMVLEGGRLVADQEPEELLEGGLLTKTFGTQMVIVKPPGWARPAVLPDFPRLHHRRGDKPAGPP